MKLASLAVIGILTLSPSLAYAACSATYPVGNAADSVVSFLSTGTNLPFVGPSTFQPVETGTLTYDSATNTLQLCDGTAWTAVLTAASGGTSQWVDGTSGAIYYNGGNVGIGTTSPLGRLHVYNDQGGGAGRIILDVSVTSGYETRIDATDKGLELTAESDIRGLIFNTGSPPTEKMRIAGNGNVGIGTTTPAHPLDVVGNIKASSHVYANGNLFLGQDNSASIIGGSIGTDDSLSIYAGDATNDGGAIILYGRTNASIAGSIYYYANTQTDNTTIAHAFLKRTSAGANTSLMNIRTNGNMYVYGSSGVTCVIGSGTGLTTCTSDGRFKKDVTVIPSALDKLAQIRGVTYRWNEKAPTENHEQVYLGVIAQEVQRVFPQAVETNADDGSLMVGLSGLVPPMIEAIKELKVLFDGLTTKVAGIIVVNDRQSLQIEALKAANDNQAAELRSLREEFEKFKAAR